MDYATKVALACPVTTTQGATDLIGALQTAIDVAEATKPSTRNRPSTPT